MEKKLTAQGPKDRKSYTVTLPIEWVKEHHLDKTKKVQLKLAGNRVVISARRESGECAAIDGELYSHSLLKVLQGLYRRGINEIKISYTQPRLLPVISSIINENLIGYQIIEQKNGAVVIKDITREASEDFDTILRRIFLLIQELVNSREESQVKSIFDNLKKLINYCQRILVKWGSPDYSKIPFYYLLLDHLEKLSDEYRWILTLRPKENKNLALLQELNKCAREAYELYYRFDAGRYDHYESLTYQIKNQIKSAEKISVTEIHLHNLARQLNTLYADIFVLKS